MKLSLEKKAFLASLAYEPDPDIITEQLCIMFKIGLLDIEYIYIERTDTEGYIMKLGDTCVISFSGTESVQDLYQDLFRISEEIGRLLSGFVKKLRTAQ